MNNEERIMNKEGMGMKNNSFSQVDMVREAFHYQSRFKGSTMVFKIDYPVTEDPGFPYLVKDLALLAKTGFKVVIVPGAKEFIDTLLDMQNIAAMWTDTKVPARMTSTRAIPFVEMAAFHVATKFMTRLSGSKVDALIGNFVRARGLGVVDGVDLQHTGTVEKIYVNSISRCLDMGMVPILPCIGWSPSGKPYNVPSDEIALAAATALGAVKFFIVTAHRGLLAGKLKIPEGVETRTDGVRLTPHEAEVLLSANALHKPDAEPELQKTIKELELALRVCRSGVDRVHIVDGREEGSVLKELFSNLGAGTMIYADEYESVRSFRSSDLPDVLRLMEPLMLCMLEHQVLWELHTMAPKQKAILFRANELGVRFSATADAHYITGGWANISDHGKAEKIIDNLSLNRGNIY